MGITDKERTEIFTRIGQLEGSASNERTHNLNRRSTDSSGGGAKAFASVLVILTIIGGMTAIIRPIQQQIDFMTKQLKEVQVHASDGHPARVEAKINEAAKRIDNHNGTSEKIVTRINDLEQSVAVLKQQMLDGTRDRYYARDALKDKEIIEKEIENLKERIERHEQEDVREHYSQKGE